MGVHGADLRADVQSWSTSRLPEYLLWRTVGPGEDDVLWWRFDSVDELGRVIEAFEQGEELPLPPSGSSSPPAAAEA
ncbi:MAG: hypothetical protein ACRDZQ_12980 [Acidimicrobiales bacterium]